MKQILFIGLILIFQNACNNVDKDEAVKSKVIEEIRDFNKYTAKEKEAIMDEFRVRKDRTSNRIIDLNKQLIEIQQEKKQDFEKTITNLETIQNEIEHRLSVLDASSNDAYEDVKMGVDSALTNINIAIDKARKDFEKSE
jgi:predicted Fe-S protein YdhL (DUF1289 family)